MGDVQGLDSSLEKLSIALQHLLSQASGTQQEITKARDNLHQPKEHSRHYTSTSPTSSSHNLPIGSDGEVSPKKTDSRPTRPEREKEERKVRVAATRSPRVDGVHSVIIVDDNNNLPKKPITRRRTEGSEDRKQDQGRSVSDRKSLIISLPSRRRMDEGLEETMEIEVLIPGKKPGMVSVYFQVPLSYTIDNVKHWIFRKVSIVEGQKPEDYCLSINKEKLMVEFNKLADVPAVQQALKSKTPVSLELELKDGSVKKTRKTAPHKAKKSRSGKDGGEKPNKTSYYLDKVKGGIKGHRGKKEKERKQKKREKGRASHHNSNSNSSSNINVHVIDTTSTTSSSTTITTPTTSDSHINGMSAIALKQKILECEMREKAIELQHNKLKAKKRKLKEREQAIAAKEKRLKEWQEALSHNNEVTQGQRLDDIDEAVEKGKAKEKHSDKEREKEKERERDRERSKESEKGKERRDSRASKTVGWSKEHEKPRKKNKRKDKETEMEKDKREKEKERSKEKEKEKDRERKEREIEAEREKEKEREREREKEREKEKEESKEEAEKEREKEKETETAHEEERKEQEKETTTGTGRENEKQEKQGVEPQEIESSKTDNHVSSTDSTSPSPMRTSSRNISCQSGEGKGVSIRSPEIQDAVNELANAQDTPSGEGLLEGTKNEKEQGTGSGTDEVADLKRLLQETTKAVPTTTTPTISKERLEYLNSIDTKFVLLMQKTVKMWLVQRRWKLTILALRNSELSTQLQKRASALKEIVESETVYSENIKTLVQVFYLPLRSTDILSSQELQSIFSNIEEILSVSETFARDVQARFEEWPAVQSFGDIFLQYMKLFMEVYSVYIGNFDVSCEIVQNHLKAIEKSPFVKFAQENETTHFNRLKGLDLPSFLIMPVQRLPRYEILLKELVKQTPEVHSDYTTLTKALERIQTVNKFVNQEQERIDKGKARKERKVGSKQETTRARGGSTDQLQRNLHKRSRSFVQRFPGAYMRRGSTIQSNVPSSSSENNITLTHNTINHTTTNNNSNNYSTGSSPLVPHHGLMPPPPNRSPLISPKTAAHMGYGQLRLEMIQGRNMFSLDHSPPDPYMVLELGEQIQKTKILRRTSNPTWGEEFVFTIKNFKNELKLMCYDAKRLKGIRIGELNLTYSDIISCKSTEPRWITLKPPTTTTETGGESFTQPAATSSTPTNSPSITPKQKREEKKVLPEIQVSLLFIKGIRT